MNVRRHLRWHQYIDSTPNCDWLLTSLQYWYWLFASISRCPGHVQLWRPRGKYRTYWRDYLSHMAREHFRIHQRELDRQKDISGYLVWPAAIVIWNLEKQWGVKRWMNGSRALCEDCKIPSQSIRNPRAVFWGLIKPSLIIFHPFTGTCGKTQTNKTPVLF